MNGRVSISIEGGIADVQLNRPEKLNALDIPMFDAIIEAGSRLKREQALRAVVLSGSGRSFSVGIDLEVLNYSGDTPLSRLEKRTHGPCNLFQYAAMQWRDIPVPVISAIHGHALGGGFQLMLGADIRIISPDAKLSVREIAWGLIPDMSATALMRRFMRDDIVRDLVFTGRIFSGFEAKSIGVATKIDNDPYRAALKLAKEISKQSPDAIMAAKRLLNNAASQVPDSEMLLFEAKEQQLLLASSNHKEAIQAYLEGRTPTYCDVENGGELNS